MQATSGRARVSKLQLPRLRHEIRAEAPVRAALNQMETGALINAPGIGKDALRPEDDSLIAGGASERHTFGDQSTANAQSACFGLDEQKPQLRDARRLLYEKHGSDPLSVALGDPTPLPPRIEMLDVVGDDLRGQTLELNSPSVLLVIESTVTFNDPSKISWNRVA